MKTNRIEDCIEALGTYHPFAVEARAELAAIREENARLRSLLERNPPENTPEEEELFHEIFGDPLGDCWAENARLREALDFVSAHLTNDPLAAHERIRAALSGEPGEEWRRKGDADPIKV